MVEGSREFLPVRRRRRRRRRRGLGDVSICTRREGERE